MVLKKQRKANEVAATAKTDKPAVTTTKSVEPVTTAVPMAMLRITKGVSIEVEDGEWHKINVGVDVPVRLSKPEDLDKVYAKYGEWCDEKLNAELEELGAEEEGGEEGEVEAEGGEDGDIGDFLDE